VNRHNKSPIDDTRVLIGRVLVLMTFYVFECVAVTPKLVSMLLHYSSPPASLVFDVFSCEQILKRPGDSASGMANGLRSEDILVSVVESNSFASMKDNCVTVMCYSLERSSDRPGTSGPQMHA